MNMTCHSYIFFDIEQSIHSLPKTKLIAYKKTFASQITKIKNAKIHAYGTLAFHAGHRFMLHINTDSARTVQRVVSDLLHTPLGAHLRVSYTLLGLTRSSQYNPKHAPKESAPDVSHQYLVVYPFTKTIEWHLLPYEQRREIMKAHVDVGRKHSTEISQLLLYSFGIDDHEFIVSYQMDTLESFQTLVMELRNTEARRYTHNDLPIFTCVHMPITEVLTLI